MQSIDRIMKIVNAFVFTDPTRYMSITELSKECDLPLSSMHRILKAMEKHRMIKQDPEKKLYTLGMMWFEYGLRVYDTVDYVSTLRPELEKLMRNINSTVYLHRPIEKESIIIERIDCVNQTIRAYDKLGLRSSFDESIANLSMLAHMTTIQRESLNESLHMGSNPELDEQLNKIREQGYALGEDDWSKGITTVAAPINSPNKGVVGAISIKIEGLEPPQEQLDESIKELINTSNTISWKMVHHY